MIPMLEALSFPLSAEEKSKMVRFPPFSAHLEFEFLSDASGDEFIRVLFQEKPLILNGKEIMRREEFESYTSWLRKGLNFEKSSILLPRCRDQIFLGYPLRKISGRRIF